MISKGGLEQVLNVLLRYFFEVGIFGVIEEF